LDDPTPTVRTRTRARSDPRAPLPFPRRRPPSNRTTRQTTRPVECTCDCHRSPCNPVRPFVGSSASSRRYAITRPQRPCSRLRARGVSAHPARGPEPTRARCLRPLRRLPLGGPTEPTTRFNHRLSAGSVNDLCPSDPGRERQGPLQRTPPFTVASRVSDATDVDPERRRRSLGRPENRRRQDHSLPTLWPSRDCDRSAAPDRPGPSRVGSSSRPDAVASTAAGRVWTASALPPRCCRRRKGHASSDPVVTRCQSPSRQPAGSTSASVTSR